MGGLRQTGVMFVVRVTQGARLSRANRRLLFFSVPVFSQDPTAVEFAAHVLCSCPVRVLLRLVWSEIFRRQSFQDGAVSSSGFLCVADPISLYFWGRWIPLASSLSTAAMPHVPRRSLDTQVVQFGSTTDRRVYGCPIPSRCCEDSWRRLVSSDTSVHSCLRHS